MAATAVLTGRTRGQWLARPLLPELQASLAHVLTWELSAYLALTGIAFTLRIWDVGYRAMHHDESLHATYAWYLFKGMGYQYNPLMHGPLQFFAMAFFYLLFGDSETTARLFAVICGTLIVFLPYLLRRKMGRPAALIAAVALTISPTFLYYSRFVRDDIYLAFFALLMAVAMWKVLGSNEQRHTHAWVLIFFAAAALAMASMEASYILFFVFGSFIGLCVLLEWLASQRAVPDGDERNASRNVTVRLLAIRLDTWLYALGLFVAITILLYSSFFTNLHGLWDPDHSLLSAQRTDILGGLTYWLSQHGVARGGQPWFYYFLLMPLYEQFALIFGVAGSVWAFFRRDLFTTFLAYWFGVSLAIYSWAGEKMPWLLLHPLLPATLLAAVFAGWALTRLNLGWRVGIGALLALLAVTEIHSAQALAYADGANPTEMLIYVQTSQDVPRVANEIVHLLPSIPSSDCPAVQVDSADLQGWPFEWYFRNLASGTVSYSSDFSRPTAPVLLMLGPEEAQYGAALMKKYQVAKYTWNWWFPEDYKGLTFDHGMCGTAAAETACATGQTGFVFLRTGSPCPPTATVAGSNCSLIQQVPAINVWSALAAPATWHNLWNWFVWRTPFGQRGSRQLYVFVRKDLVPKWTGSASQGSTPTPPPPVTGKSLPYKLLRTITDSSLLSPKGLEWVNGHVYVADGGSQRIEEFTQSGRLIKTVGSSGAGEGQFNANESPIAVAVGHHGRLYVADFWNHRIQEFSARGSYEQSWGQFGSAGAFGFYGPRSVAVAPNGNVVVADTGNRRIAVFSGSGKFLFQFGTTGTGTGQFEEPSAVTVAKNGDIYVADYWNGRIQRFTSRGVYLGQWAVAGWQSGLYVEPYLAVMSNGDVACTVPTSGLIDVFKPSGKLVGTLQIPQITAPLGLAAAPHDELAVSDANGSAIALVALRH